MGKEQDLLQAVKDQDVGSVEKFLAKYHNSKKIVGSSKKLNINQQDADGMSVLHHAALLGSVEILKLLLDHGALVDITDVKGLRPLHYAAWQGHARLTEILLHQGSSVNKPALDGNIPLHLACEHGHFDVVQKLLDYGANICMANSQHKMPLDLACEFGRTSVVERLLESESCRAVLRDTSNDTVDNDRTTCLHLAARNGHIDTIRLLLEAGIDINRATLQGTCLHEAAKYGKTDVVRLLLSCGIDVSRLNSYEQTALELVNKFTMTRAARELKQLLKEAGSEIRVMPICDHVTGSDSQNPKLFKEGSFPTEDQSSTTAGTWKNHRNRFDSHSAGHAMVYPPDANRTAESTCHKKKSMNSCHWNRSSPQPPPIEVLHFGRSVGIDGEHVSSSQSPSGKNKHSSHGTSGGLLAHLLAHGAAAGFQTGASGDSPNQTLQSQHNACHSGASDDGHSKDGSNRMSGGSSGKGSYHSGGSQQSAGCQNRLSGQSYESGVSGISSRQSCHSSSSSQGSLDHMEESGYSSTVNVHELLQQGLSDTDILCTWLSSLHLEELSGLFVDAGYDMPTITRMTPEDLTAIGITKPSMRKKLKSEISKLSIGDGIPDYRPRDLFDWLSSLHLDEYHETLVKQGFGSLDTVTKITWEDLEEIGIKKLGHQKKIMLAIDRLKRINTILHRLSGSSQSSNEALNCHDSSVTDGKLQSCILSSIPSSSSTSSPSFLSASSQYQSAQCENVLPWKPNTKKNCGGLNERLSIERFGSNVQSASVEIHSIPLTSLPVNFPLSNMTSIDHNTYPALPESSSKHYPIDQVPRGDATDSDGSSAGLDGDATPTNERKLLGSIDGTKGYVRTSYSREEPMDFYKADQQNLAPHVMSSYSTLPKKICGKRRINDLNGYNDLGFSGFLNFENVLSSKKTNHDPGHSVSVEKPCPQPVLNRQRKEPPPPPKRSDSFKTYILASSVGNRDRMRMRNENSSDSSHVLSGFSSEPSTCLTSIFANNHTAAESNPVVNASTVPDTTRATASSSGCANMNAVEFQCDKQQKQRTSNETINDCANPHGGNFQDARLSEASDDSDSGLESRHSASSASLESSGSGGGIESNTLPFANENVGTIKQRNPSSKPSILNGDGSELNKGLFENETETLRCSIQTDDKGVDNASSQNSQFMLVNGEIISEAIVSNGNLPYGVNPDDVFDDIDGMLNGLTQELDEMLKFQG